MKYRPYSMYGYGQVDGRIKFDHYPRRDMLLVNITQMTLYYNPSARCNLIVMSFEPNCRIWTDSRYVGIPFEDLIAEGNPFVLGIRDGFIESEPLDPNKFFCKF